MNSIDKYDLISESLMDNVPDHPNIDQIIVKAYLFCYVPHDKVRDIEKNGIVDGGVGVHAYFTRIPKLPQFKEFLAANRVVKISVSKLTKSSDKVRVRGVNFPGYVDKELILKKEQLDKMAEKSDKFYKFFENAKTINDVPKAKIEFQDGVIPPFTFKILDSDVTEGLSLVSEVLLSSQLISLATLASKDLDAYSSKSIKKLPKSVHTLLVKTKKMKELKELLPMAKRSSISLKVSNPEFIAARAIVNGIIRSNDSKSELIMLSEK